MKENDFIILFVLVCGIFLGAAIHTTISRQKYKPDIRGRVPIESVYDSRFRGFEWRGHKYLKYGSSSNSSVLHDPDCPCWSNRLEAVK